MNKTFVKRHLKERYCFCLKEFPGWNEILNITTAPIVQKVRLRLWIMQGLLISHIKLCNSDTVFDHLVAVWTHTHTQCHQFKVHSCSSSFTGMAGYYGIKKIWSFMEKKTILTYKDYLNCLGLKESCTVNFTCVCLSTCHTEKLIRFVWRVITRREL